MICARLRLKCDGTRAETRFHLWTKRTSPFKSAGGVSSVDYWQASCAHQPIGFVLLMQACVLLSCDAYWLPNTFSCLPFTSPPVRHRVPSHFNWTLPTKLPLHQTLPTGTSPGWCAGIPREAVSALNRHTGTGLGHASRATFQVLTALLLKIRLSWCDDVLLICSHRQGEAVRYSCCCTVYGLVRQ